MNAAKKLFLMSAALLCLFGYQASDAVAENPPNVIFVLADDLGIGDISPTNPDCKIQTANLQKMADEGMTFFDAHTSSAVCTPTRYGLLTGRYNWRSRLAKGVLGGSSKHLIPEERATVAHLLRDAGYHTQMIGKWHLGWDWAKVPDSKGKQIDFAAPVLNGPNINGFDGYYGHCGSLDMAPYVWVDTGQPTSVPKRESGVSRKEDRYGWYRKGPIADDFQIDQVLPLLFQKSMDHIRQHAPKSPEDKPFFLYLALPAPHTPIVPVPPFKDASGINPYADFVMQVDHHMGELFAAIKEAGIDDNTIVIFSSDNGCSPEANFELLEKFDHHPSGKYRGHKADIFEGGHRVPFIVRWPENVKAGSETHSLTCLTDFYSTMQELTGQESKDQAGEDSYSILPVIKGQAATGQRKSLISHSISGHFAIREGNWKLCLSSGSAGWSKPHEKVAIKKGLPSMQLFDLAADPGETKNLVSEHPDRVKVLLQLLQKQVDNGRCTPGQPVPNDRDVTFLPEGVTMPE